MDAEMTAERDHWSERGRATSLGDANTLGRPRRSLLALRGIRKVQSMKRMPLLLAAGGMLVTNGCISMHLVKDEAQPHLEYRVDRDKWEQINGKPGYYALLPLTVAGDLATSPFQLGYLLFTDKSHQASADIRGIPIPLP